MKVKEESEKAGLKLTIQKRKIMASGPITSWEIDGETVENSESDENTRTPDLPLEKPVCRSEATVRTGYGTTDWFQIEKGVCQGCILSPCLFNFYAEYIMKMLDWKKHKLESRLPGEISITSDMQMTPPLWQKVKRNLKAS